MKRSALVVVRCALVAATCGLASFCSATAIPDPVIWYDMESVVNGKVPDKSGNGRDLMVGAGVSVVDSDLGCRAISFDGTSAAYASFSCPALSDHSVSLWFKCNKTDTATEPYRYLFSVAGFVARWGRSQVSPDIEYVKNPGQSQTELTTGTGKAISRTKWHHLVFTVLRKGTSANSLPLIDALLYIDGNLVSQISDLELKVDFAASVSTALIGNINAAGTGNRQINGELADFRLYGEALDASGVSTLYCEHLKNGTLVAWWPMDSRTENGDGTFTTPDATGNGADMTLGGNVELVRDGVDGKAVRFMATSAVYGAATVPETTVPIGDYTVTCWIRRSSRASEYYSEHNNANPRFLQGPDGYSVFSTLDGNGCNLALVPDGYVDNKFSADALSDIDTWSHLAVVRTTDAGISQYHVYVNGNLSGSGSTYETKKSSFGGASFILGNMSVAGNRYFIGDFDDLRFYSGALTADQVRRVYSGIIDVSAGEDFAVAGEVAELHGIVACRAPGGIRKGTSGVTAWTCTAWPEGGSGVSIENLAGVATKVSLPVVGAYTFRLTATDMGASRTDEVIVTRIATIAGNAKPSVSVSGDATAELPGGARLTAEVADADSVPGTLRSWWELASGPAGVWFCPQTGPSTTVTFAHAGTYTIRCRASDGQGETFADFAVSVSESSAEYVSITNGLKRHWTLDGKTNPFNPEQISGSKTGTSTPNYTTLCYKPGIVGYGVRCSGDSTYFDTGITAFPGEEGGTANTAVTHPFVTISAWVYVDPDDTSACQGATVVGKYQSFGLRYREKAVSPSEQQPGFTIYQNGVSNATMLWHYPAPSPSPVGRWLHLCAVVDRAAGTQMEMWYDGVRQEKLETSSGENAGRHNANKITIGGWSKTDGNSFHDAWAGYSRTFPGIIDEVMIWDRKLSAGEIRYLAQNADLSVHRAPAIGGLPGQSRVKRGEVSVFDATIDGDPMRNVEGMAYEWRIIGGTADPALAEFSAPTSARTEFATTARAGLTYVLQLVVDDGTRTAYSDPIEVAVDRNGMMISFR